MASGSLTVEAELALRRRCSELVLELADSLDQEVEFAEALHDALQRVVECTGAERALVLGWHKPGKRIFVLGTSDDPNAARLRVDAALFPELEGLAGTPRVLETRAATGPRVAVYREINDGEKERLLLLAPMRHLGRLFGVIELHLASDALVAAATHDLLQNVASVLAPRLRASDLYQSLPEQTNRVAVHEIEGGADSEALGRYMEFFRRSFDGIVVIDQDDRVVYLNPAGEQVTGYSRAELVGTPVERVVAEGDREALAQILAQVRQQQAGHSFDVALITTSGDPIVAAVSTSVLAKESLLVLSFRDITEARALSDELHATKEFLERLIDSTVDGIIATDIEGRVLLFNQGAERLFGFEAGAVVGQKTLADLFPAGVPETLMDQLRGRAAGGPGRLQTTRREIVGAGGELVPVNLSAAIIYEGDAEVGMVGILNDLRDRLRIEGRLAQAQEKLIQTEKQTLIAELAGTAAHELNQPLTSVMGYAELLKKKLGEDEAKQRVVDTILAEADRMAEIVRKIGRITRHETTTYIGETQILDLDKSSSE